MSRNYRGDRPGGGGRGRYDDRGGGRGRGRGGGGYQRRPTECNVTVNYNSLSILDNSKEVDICVYRVAIKSASYRIQQDEAGNKKTNPDTGEFLRDWNTRSNTVMEADEKFQKRFYSSMKPWRIYKELVRDQQQKIPKFHLDVSCVCMEASHYYFYLYSAAHAAHTLLVRWKRNGSSTIRLWSGGRRVSLSGQDQERLRDRSSQLR